MLVSANRNYVIGGEVVAEATGSMNVYVRPIWANGRQIELPAYSETASGLIFISPPSSAPRIDVLEVRGILREYDTQRRAFFDPELANGRYYNVNTKVELVPEYKVLHGEEGSDVAPAVDSGYIKLAEIELQPNDTYIANSRIKNITALVNGEDNEFWTADKKSSFYLGSLSDLKTMFGLEHNRDGTHRAGIIKLPYLKIGASADALRATVIPLGRGYIVDQDEWLIGTDITSALETEGIIRARDDQYERDARIQKDLEFEARVNALELQIIDMAGKIGLLWDSVFSDMTTNTFLFTFVDLDGVDVIRGNWNRVQQRMDCSPVGRTFNFVFANLNTVTMIRGVWNKHTRVLEC
jgi:hypothetical protein